MLIYLALPMAIGSVLGAALGGLDVNRCGAAATRRHPRAVCGQTLVKREGETKI